MSCLPFTSSFGASARAGALARQNSFFRFQVSHLTCNIRTTTFIPLRHYRPVTTAVDDGGLQPTTKMVATTRSAKRKAEELEGSEERRQARTIKLEDNEEQARPIKAQKTGKWPVRTHPQSRLSKSGRLRSNKTRKTGKIPIQQQLQSPLLKLAPELRNIIYRYTLVKPDEIVVSAGALPPSSPALLQVSRQIRNEAKEIYHKENLFSFRIDDFDATTCIKWCASAHERYRSNHRWQLRKMGSGENRWVNLLNWLEAFYNRRCGGPATADNYKPSSDHNVAVYQMFKMVRNMRRASGFTWESTREQLELMYVAMVSLRPQWP